jgi:hypothetical protein
MKTRLGLASILIICAACLLSPAIRASDVETKRPLIQLAVLLDTSNSMDGLIDQARSQLWKIVNEFISAKRDGQKPEVQVALYEYGKSSLAANEGYLRMIVPLSTDLDKISEELFALRTNGGDEYCGWVIKSATEGLQWSAANTDLKMIFICGNEPFTQGRVDYKDACKAAIAKGIVVNTIHCGSEQEGINTKWKDGADLADGKYMWINADRKVAHIDAPQDAEIAKLGAELNKTYIAYGARGKESLARQAEQDFNAEKAAQGAFVNRSAAKASANYYNGGWDLVDAVKDGKKLAEMAEEELPDEVRKLGKEDRAAYVETKTKERAELQKKILELNTARNKFVAEEMKKRGSANKEDTLDAVMSKTIREQAKKQNFDF